MMRTCLIICLLTLTVPAYAHGVNIFAWAEGDTIHTESTFSGGKKVHEGTVEVLNAADGNVLVGGTTDNEGKYSFKIPRKAVRNKLDLLIVVQAGLGHRGEWPMSADEYLQAQASEDTKPSSASSKSKAVEQARKKAAFGSGIYTTLSIEEFEAMLDKKLSPINKQLAEMKQSGPGFTEILGGIGYIIGLLGLVALLRSKKS